MCKIQTRIFRLLLYKNAKALINLDYNYLWWLIYDKRKDSVVDMNLLLLSINCVWVAVITLMLFLYILVFQKIHKKKARDPGTRVWAVLPLWLGTCSQCFIGFISELKNELICGDKLYNENLSWTLNTFNKTCSIFVSSAEEG